MGECYLEMRQDSFVVKEEGTNERISITKEEAVKGLGKWVWKNRIHGKHLPKKPYYTNTYGNLSAAIDSARKIRPLLNKIIGDINEKAISYYRLKSKIDNRGYIFRIKETKKHIIIQNGEIHE